MATSIYKRLFEVQVLHDYYLSKSDLTSIYAMNANDRIQFLNQMIANGQYNVSDYLDILPSENTSALMKNYHIKIALLPSGFLVGIKVKPLLNQAGDEVYFPAAGITDPLELKFRLRPRKANFHRHVNTRIQQNAPVRYFFTNANDNGTKIFPSLSLPVSPFQAGYTYETGELAVVGGVIQEALKETSTANAATWRPVSGSGFANENDRLLLPKLFPYTFFTPMNSVTFTLKKPDGTEVKSINAASIKAGDNKYLDFRQTNSSVNQSSENIDDGFYLLEINGDTTTITSTIFLSDELYQRPDAGAISLRTDITDPAFRILNPDGSIITKKNNNGVVATHPVFEIRLKRRSAYWRYKSDNGVNFKTTANTAHFLDIDAGKLITKETRPITFYPTYFEDPTVPALPKIFLPNPGDNMITKESKKLISDIYVSPIKGLIEIQ